MNPDHLEELAAGYAAGALDAHEAEIFSKIMKSDSGIQKITDDLNEIAMRVLAADSAGAVPRPSPELKERILRRIALPAEQRKAEDVLAALSGGEEGGIVICSQKGLVEWINPAFSELCGYSLDEVRGKKPGALLQGAATDAATVKRMREAVHSGSGFSEEIINYHKDGSPYWVSITVSPILDAARNVRSYVALERKISGRPIAASA